jgi:hypothetical protein
VRTLQKSNRQADRKLGPTLPFDWRQAFKAFGACRSAIDEKKPQPCGPGAPVQPGLRQITRPPASAIRKRVGRTNLPRCTVAHSPGDQMPLTLGKNPAPKIQVDSLCCVRRPTLAPARRRADGVRTDLRRFSYLFRTILALDGTVACHFAPTRRFCTRNLLW